MEYVIVDLRQGPISSLQNCEPKKGRPCCGMSAFQVSVGPSSPPFDCRLIKL